MLDNMFNALPWINSKEISGKFLEMKISAF